MSKTPQEAHLHLMSTLKVKTVLKVGEKREPISYRRKKARGRSIQFSSKAPK
jgi:hypothetical protein